MIFEQRYYELFHTKSDVLERRRQFINYRDKFLNYVSNYVITFIGSIGLNYFELFNGSDENYLSFLAITIIY